MNTKLKIEQTRSVLIQKQRSVTRALMGPQRSVLFRLHFHIPPLLSPVSFDSVFGVEQCERKARNGAKVIRICPKMQYSVNGA